MRNHQASFLSDWVVLSLLTWPHFLTFMSTLIIILITGALSLFNAGFLLLRVKIVSIGAFHTGLLLLTEKWTNCATQTSFSDWHIVGAYRAGLTFLYLWVVYGIDRADHLLASFKLRVVEGSCWAVLASLSFKVVNSISKTIYRYTRFSRSFILGALGAWNTLIGFCTKYHSRRANRQNARHFIFADHCILWALPALPFRLIIDEFSFTNTLTFLRWFVIYCAW